MSQAPRPALVDIGELVGRLADRAPELARDLLPAGVRRGPEWHVAGADSPFGCSMDVHLTGSRAGVWGAWSAGKGGDALDLVAAVKCGGDKGAAIRWALNWLRIDPKDRVSSRGASHAGEPRKARTEPDAEAKRGAAWRLWMAARPLTLGDPVYRYLDETRGIDLAALGRLPGALRYFSALSEPETGRKFPAMVAAVTGPSGRFLTVHRTWLEVQSNGRVRKAPVENPKKVYSSCKGGLIPLWRGISGRRWREAPPGDVLGLAEGVEDGLTYAVAKPEHRVAAALNVGNLAHLRLPAPIATVIVAADNDAAGSPAEKALRRAIDRFLGEGRQVRIARCPMGFKDLNELLLRSG